MFICSMPEFKLKSLPKENIELKTSRRTVLFQQTLDFFGTPGTEKRVCRILSGTLVGLKPWSKRLTQEQVIELSYS